jgi:hypothetical protein
LTMYINSYADKRYLLSYGICSGYGLAAAAEQESVAKSTKDRATRNEKVAARCHHHANVPEARVCGRAQARKPGRQGTRTDD